jgi:hypothetical protein
VEDHLPSTTFFIVAVICLLLCGCNDSSLSASSTFDVFANENNSKIVYCSKTLLIGQVTIIGNEPFPLLVLRVSNGEFKGLYQVVGEMEKIIYELQGYQIKVCGFIQPTSGLQSSAVENEIVVTDYWIIGR